MITLREHVRHPDGLASLRAFLIEIHSEEALDFILGVPEPLAHSIKSSQDKSSHVMSSSVLISITIHLRSAQFSVASLTSGLFSPVRSHSSHVIQVAKLKAAKDEELPGLFQYLYRKYIDTHSTHQLNLPSELVSPLNHFMERINSGMLTGKVRSSLRLRLSPLVTLR